MFKVTPVMEQIALDKSKYKVVVAGRRFGKTYMSIMWLLMGHLKEGERRWIILPTYRQGRMVVFPILTKIARETPYAVINNSTLTINIAGCEISVKGSEDASKLRGSHLNRVVLDEYAYQKANVWEEVIYPMMTTDTNSQALFIGTPDGVSNGFYDLYLKGQGGEREWKSWQFKSIDGGWIPKKEIDNAKRNLDPKIFAQEFEASFETAQNRVAYNFDRNKHIKKAQKLSDVKYIGLDFNVSKMCAVVASEYTDGTIHYFDEVILHNSNTEEMCKTLRKRYPDIDVIYPDPSGNSRSTQSSKSDFAILRENGFVIRSRKSHPTQKDRINCLNRKLLSGDGNITLSIDPKCKELIKDFEQCTRDKRGGIDKSDMERTHCLDASTYLIEYRFPILHNKAISKRW